MNPTDPTETERNIAATEALMRAAAVAFDAILPVMHKAPVFSGDPRLEMPAHFGPAPLPSGRADSDALYRAVSKMAHDICDGYVFETKHELADHIAEAQTWPEWQNLRALYFVYCNGMEDALEPCLPILACAIRDNKPGWLGDVVLGAWNTYADNALVERVLSKIQEIKEDDGAVRQSESVGK